jgi:hypothetical protein
MVKQKSATFNLAKGLSMAGIHSATTLWYRWPMLAASGVAPGRSRHAPEIELMVSEKTSAAILGAFDAYKELLRVTGAAMTGRLDFTTMSDAAMAIAYAGLRPAFRTVKNNSRRLSRR